MVLYARAGEPNMRGEEYRSVQRHDCRPSGPLPSHHRYQWALLIGPKHESKRDGSCRNGIRLQAKDPPSFNGETHWLYEEAEVPLLSETMILVRVMIGKVNSKRRLLSIARDETLIQDEPWFNCVIWIRDALFSIQSDKRTMGKSLLDWAIVRDEAINYLETKKAQRRFEAGSGFDITRPATWDLLQRKELIR